MKLFLALLAMLTGFSVADNVRTAEPAVAQGQGTGWNAAVAAEEGPIAVQVAVYLAAVLLPLFVCARIAHAAAGAADLSRVLPTIFRSDRLRQ